MYKKKIINNAKRIVLSVFGIGSLSVFVVFPFLHNFLNHILAQTLWYTSILVLMFFVITIQKRKKKSLADYTETTSFLVFLVIFISVFIINYYETTYSWFWMIFIIVFIGIPLMGNSIRKYLTDIKSLSTVQQNNFKINLSKVTLLWWILDLFYMGIFMNWLTIQFVFGGLAMVVIFMNLSSTFLSSTMKFKWILIQDFIIGIGLTIYLIYIIPNDNLQNILIPVISGVYGGLITLVGVSWTIKETRSDVRVAKLNEIKPIFFPVSEEIKENVRQILNAPEEGLLPGTLVTTLGQLENSSKIDFFISTLLINGIEMFPIGSNRIKPNEIFEICHATYPSFTEIRAQLVVYDIEENFYKYDILFGNNPNQPKIVRIKEIVSNE